MSSGRRAKRREKQVIKRIDNVLKPQWKNEEKNEIEKSNYANLIGDKRERRRAKHGYVKIRKPKSSIDNGNMEKWKRKEVKIIDHETYWDTINYERNKTLYCNTMEIDLIYEDGVFKLLSNVKLKKYTKTKVIVKSNQVISFKHSRSHLN